MLRFFTLLAILILFTYPLTVPLLHADAPGSIPTAPEFTSTPDDPCRCRPTAEPVLYKVYVPYFVNGGTDGREWPLPY